MRALLPRPFPLRYLADDFSVLVKGGPKWIECRGQYFRVH